MTAQDWIDTLDLERHPEGGYYRETYRSDEQLDRSVLPARFDGDRSFSTAIYFLLEAGQISAFHRIASDELWCFHTGAPLRIEHLNPNGSHTTHHLGPVPERGQVFQCVIPATTWFGACVDANIGYSLVSCAVAPGFDFADFELADREKLTRAFPHHKTLITQLTRAPMNDAQP
jgi:predicted cupin superfamily sugar epimerase